MSPGQAFYHFDKDEHVLLINHDLTDEHTCGEKVVNETYFLITYFMIFAYFPYQLTK